MPRRLSKARCLQLVSITVLLAAGVRAAPVDDTPPVAVEPPLVMVPEAAHPPTVTEPAPQPALPAPAPPPASPFTVSGIAEAYYQLNFQQPSNGITNGRGFDNRANTFTLSSALVDGKFELSGFVAELALQLGSFSVTSYLAEPTQAGTPSVAPSGAELWRLIQQAHLGYRVPVGAGLLLEAGIFLSPIGPEAPVSKDNWNISRSTLFFALPFYHTGARASYPLSKQLTATVAVYNGWNSVVDNNPEKSVSGSLAFTTDTVTASLLYFGGVERSGEGLGRPWRHLLDGWAQWQVSDRVALLGQVNVGFEVTASGLQTWQAGAVSTRLKVLDRLFVSARADLLREGGPEGLEAIASPIFFPAALVGSVTATVDVRPVDHLALRLEYRHDQASAPLYFGGQVEGDGQVVPYQPNRTSQDTLTLAAMGWF